MTFQTDVYNWAVSCFDKEIANDKVERNHRFLEEALELVQANNCSRLEAHQLVDYVFDRPVGEIHQEIGGVMVTRAALASALGISMQDDGYTELNRILQPEIMEKIKAKQKNKPKHSPLPMTPTGKEFYLERHQ